MSEQSGALAPTARIVIAYVARNTVAAAALPGLVHSVHVALKGLSVAPVATKDPAVPVDQSVTRTHLVSLENGRKYKVLKRHVKALGMTPEQYRKKWGLPADYPMVAVGYSRLRSRLAKANGLGQKQARA